MIMRFEDWLHTVIENGTICEKELNNLSTAYSKKQIMDVALHPDGLYYICEIGELGYRLPYETILREFSHYINGKYKKENVGESGRKYTTSLYCCCENENGIIANATMMAFLGCKNNVIIPDNFSVSIYADSGCSLNVICPDSARCRITTFGDAKITSNNDKNVKIITANLK